MELPIRRLLARMPWLGPLLLVGLMVTALAAVMASGLTGVSSEKQLSEMTASYGLWAPLAYVALYALVAFIFPVSLLSVAGGLLFGLWPGILLSVMGGTLGGLASFLAARYLGLKSLEGWVKERLKASKASVGKGSRPHPLAGYRWVQARFEALESPASRQSWVGALATLVLLRLVWFIPFFAVSFGAGLSRMRLGVFVAGTLIGTTLANLILLTFSDSLLGIDTPGELLTWRFLLALLLFGLMLALPYRYLRRRTPSAQAEGAQ